MFEIKLLGMVNRINELTLIFLISYKMTQHIAEEINQSREQVRDQIQNWSGRNDIQGQ